jgi:hypothetical protein
MAEIHPELMFVSDVNKGDLDRGGSSSCFDVLPDPKGVVKGLCSFSYEELCRFKYLINASVGGTYSGRLKYLFLCGAPGHSHRRPCNSPQLARSPPLCGGSMCCIVSCAVLLMRQDRW